MILETSFVDLSGGQQQRALTRAVCATEKLIVLMSRLALGS